jgi:hypothetical protein
MGSRPGNCKAGNFLPGNQAAKGHGRPKCLMPALRRELNEAFLERSEPRFGEICDKLLSEAVKGNMKAIEFVFKWCVYTPRSTALEEPMVDEFEIYSPDIERIRNMTTPELLLLSAKSMSEAKKEDQPFQPQ